MIPITVIPIILAIALIPPVLTPDSDPIAFLNNIIPSIQVACAQPNGNFLCIFVGNSEVGSTVFECEDDGCIAAGGRCVLILEPTAQNGAGFCMCELPAVGGWFFEVDKPALLVAGAQMNAAWMIPVIVSAIGIGIVIARKF